MSSRNRKVNALGSQEAPELSHQFFYNSAEDNTAETVAPDETVITRDCIQKQSLP